MRYTIFLDASILYYMQWCNRIEGHDVVAAALVINIILSIRLYNIILFFFFQKNNNNNIITGTHRESHQSRGGAEDRVTVTGGSGVREFERERETDRLTTHTYNKHDHCHIIR